MSRENNSLRLDRAFWLELIRFLLVGVYGTLIDYVVEVWATSIFASWIGATENYIAAFFIQFLIIIIGFIVATPSTWSLSAIWAFKDSATQESKSLRGAAKFTGFAFLGLLGGAIIQFLGYMICLKWSGWGINILDIDFSTLFGEDIKVFASYTVVFVLKTAFTTVFNYVTRKFVLYRKSN